MKIYIVLGDWSGDGHGKTDKVLLNVNKTKKEMQAAYKQSCKTLGVSFNHNEDFTGIKPQNKNRLIATEYEEPPIPLEAYNILKENGFDFSDIIDYEDYADGDGNIPTEITEDVYISQDGFVNLLMQFIRFSLPGFEWEEIVDSVENFNGYWNKGLNVQLGYGLYN